MYFDVVCYPFDLMFIIIYLKTALAIYMTFKKFYLVNTFLRSALLHRPPIHRIRGSCCDHIKTEHCQSLSSSVPASV